MTVEQELVMELRTIKTLLAIDKKDKLEELTEEFTPIQEHILGILDPYEWRSLPTSDIADEMEVGNRSVRDHRSNLEDRNLVEKRGDGRGAEYRITGLLGCAELLGLIDSDLVEN